MKNHALTAILSSLVLASTAYAQHSGHHSPAAAPYAGQEKRTIKALSADQVEDLKAGRGMGLALAAELNGYPGPMHVLEHAERLQLTSAQTHQMQTLVAAMKLETIGIGRDIIEAETALDALFARRQATPETLVLLVKTVADAQGRLRAAHLRYHLDTHAALSPAQIEHYARLRGYAAQP